MQPVPRDSPRSPINEMAAPPSMINVGRYGGCSVRKAPVIVMTPPSANRAARLRSSFFIRSSAFGGSALSIWAYCWRGSWAMTGCLSCVDSLAAGEATHHFAAEDDALDLARTLEDAGHADVAEVALDRELARVAVAAEDLHGPVAGRVGPLARHQLGHRRLGGEALALLLEPRGAQHQQ